LRDRLAQPVLSPVTRISAQDGLMPVRPRFLRDVALTGGATLLHAFCAMIGGILVARLLGPSAKGQLSVLTSLGSAAVLLSSLGIHQSVIYFLGRSSSDRDAVLSNTLLVGGTGGLAAGGALCALALALHDILIRGIPTATFLIYLPVVPLAYFNAFARRAALGASHVTLFNLPELVQALCLSLGTVVTFAAFGRHLVPQVGLRVVAELLTAVILLVAIRQLVAFRFRPSKAILKRQATYGIRNYSASVLWLLLLQSDILLCNYFLGSRLTGIYSVAVAVGLPLTVLTAAVSPILFQRVSHDQSHASRVANTNRVTRLLVPLTVAVALLIALFGYWLITLVYGSRFSGAYVALLILLPGLMTLTIETVLMQFLGGVGSPSIIYRAPIVGTVLNIGANLFVIPRWGINGASFTSTVCYAVVLLLVLRFYLRYTGSALAEVLAVTRDDIRLATRVAKPVARTAS
jgi:O-antigen/teichoic acid export membrane protein